MMERPIAPVQVTDSAGWNATFGMHRADLVNFLAAALPAGVVKTGHRATGFAQDDKAARVTFDNGAVAEADIVVACDGIHSELRPFVFPPSHAVFSGTVAYRGLVPHAQRAGLADEMRGRCGWGAASISWCSRCAPANSSTMSASFRPMRR